VDGRLNVARCRYPERTRGIRDRTGDTARRASPSPPAAVVR